MGTLFFLIDHETKSALGIGKVWWVYSLIGYAVHPGGLDGPKQRYVSAASLRGPLDVVAPDTEERAAWERKLCWDMARWIDAVAGGRDVEVGRDDDELPWEDYGRRGDDPPLGWTLYDLIPPYHGGSIPWPPEARVAPSEGDR